MSERVSKIGRDIPLWRKGITPGLLSPIAQEPWSLRYSQDEMVKSDTPLFVFSDLALAQRALGRTLFSIWIAETPETFEPPLFVPKPIGLGEVTEETWQRFWQEWSPQQNTEQFFEEQGWMRLVWDLKVRNALLLPTQVTSQVSSLGRGSAMNTTISPFEKLDYGLSLRISLQTGAIWGHCYENAHPTFFAFPELFESDGLFVEGWMVFEHENNVVLMEHGWLSGLNRIIDPTIVLTLTPDQPVSYFPGVCRAQAELEALEGEFFPHVRFDKYDEDGMGHPDYRSAYEAAKACAQAITSEAKTFLEVRASEPEEDESPIQMFIIQVLEGGAR